MEGETVKYGSDTAKIGPKVMGLSDYPPSSQESVFTFSKLDSTYSFFSRKQLTCLWSQVIEPINLWVLICRSQAKRPFTSLIK